MTKKKIIHIIQSLGNGGCENMLLRTLPLLDTFDHTIITLKNPGDLAPQFISAGITVKTVSCTGIFDIPGILRLRKLVRSENTNIIITYLFHADMLGRLFLRISKMPVIPFLRTTYNHPKYLIARILEWITKPLVNRYLANSVAVKDFYIKHIGVHPEKITVIPNGIDIKYFDSITSDPDLRKSLGINPDDFVIICVANLHINKGHRYLLEAFESLHTPQYVIPSKVEGSQSRQNLKLLIVGDGDEKENLLHQIENYQSKENILFLRKRSDVPQLLKISNLFVLPTLFEGMSNAIMEAMAIGLPIITTNIPENEILIEHEKTGLLIPTKDSSAITQTIKKLLNDGNKRKELGENALIKIQEQFDTKIITSQFFHFFNSL